jgi:putative tryptophan/tyrosine transport system substrate-binding protein
MVAGNNAFLTLSARAWFAPFSPVNSGVLAARYCFAQRRFSVFRRRMLKVAIVGIVAVVARPLELLSQPLAKTYRIGFIAHRYEKFYDPLFAGLKELGYIEGQNLFVERRYAEGNADHFKEFAAEMVRLKVDAIIVVTTPAGMAAKHETKTIPIIHPAAIDPVGTGLIASLAHPGGNVTGLAVLNAETSAKRVELLREVVPGLESGSVLWNSANPANSLAWRETEEAALKVGIKLRSQEVRSPKDFEKAFSEMMQEPPRVLLVVQDALTLEFRKEIIDFTLRNKVPGMFVGKEWVEEGGLMSYGDRLPERYRRAADLVDKVLRGTKPADLPVEQPTTFELAVNLKAAKSIGLTFLPSFLARADVVIE